MKVLANKFEVSDKFFEKVEKNQYIWASYI